MTTTTILNPDCDFLKIGVDGLDKEQLGLQHVKGIFLYGPPGTGKISIEDAVRAATTNALNKLVSQGQGKVEIYPNAVESFLVTKADFDDAISDIKPAFGSGTDDADHCLDIGIIENGNPISCSIEDGTGKTSIEDSVRAATTNALNKFVSQGQVEIYPNAVESFLVTKADFDDAISDIKPAFGSGIFKYDNPISCFIEDGEFLVKQAQFGSLVSPVSLLLHGPAGSGKTALAAHLAYKLSNSPFVKVVSPENMIGYSESSKRQAIKKIFNDAYKSELSCIIVDDIEGLLEYVPIGPSFSNVVLQTLIVLLKKKAPKNHKLLIIATCNSLDVLRSLRVLGCFDTTIFIPSLRDVIYMKNVLRELNVYDNDERHIC
ncbi:vesicle-fusing ATPase-like [Hydra vulgaris]|uniref:Vesicle-fusing ATPase n=1 Tax=Hydra vulgaris TaxID=6087 RepID=A0ABM4DA06_HYDVU